MKTVSNPADRGRGSAFRPGTPTRVMLYSHDSWGLGHLRRSLAIAGALHQSVDNVDILIVSGSPVATQFDLPEHCDVLKLPAVSKNAEGQYVPRSLAGELASAIDLRTRLITEAYRSFRPHVVIVDHQLTGLLNEALPMLRLAKSDGRLLIYGMRDVLDSPAAVDKAWAQAEQRWALREAYDHICIYGDDRVFDPRERYAALDGLDQKITFSGYVVSPLDVDRRAPVPSLRKRVVVMMGGGEDGVSRVQNYIDALALSPVHWDSHIITGPLMEEEQVRHFRRSVYKLGLSEQVRLSRFLPHIQRILQESDVAVSMAGYNSCAEIMQSRIPAILMPREHPRKEQLIRALRFEELGLVKCLRDPAPLVLRNDLEQLLEQRQPAPEYPRLDGLENVNRLVRRMSAEKSRSRVNAPDRIWSQAN